MPLRNLGHGMTSKLRIIGLALLLAGTLDTACAYLWFHAMRAEIGPGRDTVVDAAIVPFSGFGSASGVDSETQRRLTAAISLYKNHRVRYVLCVGGARPSVHLWGSQRMKQVLVSAEIPEDAILLDLQSNDTISNMQEALRILKQRNLTRAVIVSSLPQLNRIRRIVAESGFSGQIEFAPYDYSSCAPRVTAVELWLQIHHEWIADAARSRRCGQPVQSGTGGVRRRNRDPLCLDVRRISQKP